MKCNEATLLIGVGLVTKSFMTEPKQLYNKMEHFSYENGCDACTSMHLKESIVYWSGTSFFACELLSRLACDMSLILAKVKET